MRTSHFSDGGGGSPYRPPSWTQTRPPPLKEYGTRDRNPRNMGLGTQTGSDKHRDPLVDRQTPVKTLPCPKLYLRTRTIGLSPNKAPFYQMEQIVLIPS